MCGARRRESRARKWRRRQTGGLHGWRCGDFCAGITLRPFCSLAHSVRVSFHFSRRRRAPSFPFPGARQVNASIFHAARERMGLLAAAMGKRHSAHSAPGSISFSRQPRTREREGKYIFISPGLTLFAVYSGADGAVDDTLVVMLTRTKCAPRAHPFTERKTPANSAALLFLSLHARRT